MFCYHCYCTSFYSFVSHDKSRVVTELHFISNYQLKTIIVIFIVITIIDIPLELFLSCRQQAQSSAHAATIHFQVSDSDYHYAKTCLLACINNFRGGVWFTNHYFTGKLSLRVCKLWFCTISFQLFWHFIYLRGRLSSYKKCVSAFGKLYLLVPLSLFVLSSFVKCFICKAMTKLYITVR